MSERIEDKIKDENKKLEAELDVIEKELDDLSESARRDIEQAGNDYQAIMDDVGRNNNATSSKPLESVGATTYKPPTSTPVGQGVKRDGGSGLESSNTGLESPNNGLQNNQNNGYNPNEAAPDVGKDYGESFEPGNNGYNPYYDPDNGVNQATDDDIEKRVPSEASQEDAARANQGISGEDDGTKKPNALDEIDKEKQAKEAQKAQEQQGSKNPDTQKDSSSTNEPKKSEDSSPQVGNGYGAIDRRKNAPNTPSATQPGVNDSTKNARKAMNHNKKVNDSTTPQKKNTGSTGGKSGLMGGLSTLGSKLKQGVKNSLNRKTQNEVSNGEGGGDSQQNSFFGDLLKRLGASLLSNPYVLIGLGVVIIIIIAILSTMDDEMGGGNRGSKTCSYNLAGVTSTGNVELTNLKVQVVNCDATEEGFQVLETVDFEKYVLGVALAEAGPSSPDEAIKAQIIAVRNFTLTRNSGMCPSNPDNCFYGYNASTGIIRMRACTNDQVYWDYTKDCPFKTRENQPTLYCVGVESTEIWKHALSEERIAEVEALASEVLGEVLLDENGNVLKVGYQKDETDTFIEMANNNSTYIEILETVYGSSQYSSASCKYGNLDYGDYVLSSDNTTILNGRLDDFLADNGSSLEEFNELIADNVEKAGYGTREGVVMAAVTLIAELGNNYGVKVPYYLSGGHYDGVVVGALGYWGDTCRNYYGYGNVYNVCGLDCSGFVPWAIKNGGFNPGVRLASDFQYIEGANKVTLTNSPVMQPGDLLESDGHVVLIVGIDEEAGQYICAEAAGKSDGVLFTRRAFKSSGYWGVDMEDYYNNPSNVRSS